MPAQYKWHDFLTIVGMRELEVKDDENMTLPQQRFLKENRRLAGRLERSRKQLSKVRERLKRELAARRHIEEELRLKEQLLDNTGDEISVLDGDGNIIYVNERFCKSRGYSRQELIGRNIHQLDIPSTGGRVWSIINGLQGKRLALSDGDGGEEEGIGH